MKGRTAFSVIDVDILQECQDFKCALCCGIPFYLLFLSATPTHLSASCLLFTGDILSSMIYCPLKNEELKSKQINKQRLSLCWRATKKTVNMTDFCCCFHVV